MAKVEIDFADYFREFTTALGSDGALIVSLDESGKPNIMTIGWGLLGIVWGLPMCTVLVRPSRYSYSCLEATGDFTCNLPYPEQAHEALLCGTQSGRDIEKFAECGFTPLPSQTVKSPGIAECGLIIECDIVQKNDVVPEHFAPKVIQSSYPGGDFHRVYYGEILRAVADEDFRDKFRS